MTITARTILDLLARRHWQDVFVPECKDGPSRVGMLRMDAWTMKRSWTHSCATVYEIKVSRSDFLQDDKWRGYLPYCNQFYFVCPPGVIDKSEIPPEAGLLVTTTNGARLLTKKKAPYYERDIPDSLYRYVLKARARITTPNESSIDRREFWKQWLAGKNDDLDLGYQVGRKLRHAIASQVVSARSRNKELKKRIEGLEHVADLCRQLDINPSVWVSKERFNQTQRENTLGITGHFRHDLQRAAQAIQNVIETIQAEIPE